MTLGCVLEARYNSGRLILITASIKKQIQEKLFENHYHCQLSIFLKVWLKCLFFYFGSVYCKVLLMNHYAGEYK